MSARTQILDRIRTAIGDQPVPQPWHRDYQTHGPIPPGDPRLLDLLADRLVDYAATVHRCGPSGLAEFLTEVTRRWRTVVPPGFPLTLPATVADEPPLDHRALNKVDAVLTGCAAACADTGTIVLDAGPGQGRRASTLIPD